jgi:CheY-like chemotaxis protein
MLDPTGFRDLILNLRSAFACGHDDAAVGIRERYYHCGGSSMSGPNGILIPVGLPHRPTKRRKASREGRAFFKLLRAQVRGAEKKSLQASVPFFVAFAGPVESLVCANTTSVPISKPMIPAMTKRALIAIVDDDESIRVMTATLMRSLGFAARGFASAEQFLQSPELSETSCLISDVQMPGISGLELQSRLASENCRTPIIFITAFPDPRIQDRALADGAVCFLTKPFDGRTLIQCVDRALNRSNS